MTHEIIKKKVNTNLTVVNRYGLVPSGIDNVTEQVLTCFDVNFNHVVFDTLITFGRLLF